MQPTLIITDRNEQLQFHRDFRFRHSVAAGEYVLGFLYLHANDVRNYDGATLYSISYWDADDCFDLGEVCEAIDDENFIREEHYSTREARDAAVIAAITKFHSERLGIKTP